MDDPSKLHSRLAEIAESIEKGEDPSQFKAELDSLLGTEIEDRDGDVESAWEDTYNRNKE